MTDKTRRKCVLLLQQYKDVKLTWLGVFAVINSFVFLLSLSILFFPFNFHLFLLFSRIADAVFINGKYALRFWQAWGVNDFTNSLASLTFLET